MTCSFDEWSAASDRLYRVARRPNAWQFADWANAGEDWAKAAGIEPWNRLSKASITPRLKELGYEPWVNDKDQIKGWFGLTLNDD